MGPPSPRGEGGPFACAIWGRVQNCTLLCHAVPPDHGMLPVTRAVASDTRPRKVAQLEKLQRVAMFCRVVLPIALCCGELARGAARPCSGPLARGHIGPTPGPPRYRFGLPQQASTPKQRAPLSNNVETLRNMLKNRKRPGAWSVDRPDMRAYHSELRVLWTDADVP